MADNRLRRLPENPTAQRLVPVVISEARPEAGYLRDARALLNRDESLRTFVQEARASGMNTEAAVDGLSIRLNAFWNGAHAQEAYEVARYLWDEQDQLGDGVYLASNETGLVVAALSDEDIYQPSPVPRENGALALPLPRLRPELETAITCWAAEKGREERVLQALAVRAHQTDLLREEGDPRLLVATRSGRRHIVAEMAKTDPKTLLQFAGGTAGIFLHHFELRAQDPEASSGLTLLEGTCYSTSVMGVQDPLTTNLSHNRPASLRGAMVQGWVREVARQMAQAAFRLDPAPEEIPQMSLTKEHLGRADFWVSPPEAVRYLRRADPNLAIMPVSCSQPIGLVGRLGALVVPEAFDVSSREMFDRWEASSGLSFRLWVDWTRVQRLALSGIELQAVLA